jgi:PEP-CTERM motif
VSEITGTISGLGAEDYYSFYWGGGAFSATASVTGASSGGSYVFSAGAASACSSVGSEMLNSGDGFSNTISDSNLSPGEYCIGLDANSANDPGFSLTFSSPVSNVPEPGTFMLLLGGFVTMAIASRAASRRTR